MLTQAAAELDIDLFQSYMIGDAATDMQAGIAAGCKCIMVLTGRGIEESVKMLDLRFEIAVNIRAALILIEEAR